MAEESKSKGQQVTCPKCKTALVREETVERVTDAERRVMNAKMLNFKYFRVITQYCPNCNRSQKKRIPLSSFEYSKLEV